MSSDGESRLLTAATASAANERYLADDIACLLFPRAGELPSEELQASTRLALRSLVAGIEARLESTPAGGQPRSWETLCASGLLREPALIDFCVARIAEKKIRERLDMAGADVLVQLPARLLSHENPAISDMARDVLAAENSVLAGDARSLVDQLPAELLHQLSWRIVAVLKMLDGTESTYANEGLIQACNWMLAGSNEAASLQSSTAKLVYFLPNEMQAELADPVRSGLSVFIAGLSRWSGVSADLLYRFIEGGSAAPLLTVLKASGYQSEEAIALVHQLRGARHDDYQLPGILEDYEAVSLQEAARHCLQWASADKTRRSNP